MAGWRNSEPARRGRRIDGKKKVSRIESKQIGEDGGRIGKYTCGGRWMAKTSQ